MDARVKRAIESHVPGKINTKLWALVIATIEANERKYDQSNFGWGKPLCKTPACQAGWCEFLVDGEITISAYSRAKALLGLHNAWPFSGSFGERYSKDDSYLGPATAETIRASVNEWLKTQGHEPLRKVKPVQLAAPAVRRKGR